MAEDKFQALRVTKTYQQNNEGPPEVIFPLLCPQREKEWLDGWDSTMIFSLTDLAEQDCIFTTPHQGEQDTVWIITHYDPVDYKLEFVRHTPGLVVVKINIQVRPKGINSSEVDIAYQYTSLSPEQNQYLKNQLDHDFQENMQWWEKAVNHYISTGRKMRQPNK